MATIRTTATGSGTTGTGNRTAAITPAVGDLLVVFIAVSTNTNTAPTCSDNNADVGSYALVASLTYNTVTTPGYVLSAFVRTRLMKNTTATTVTCATGSNTSGVIVVYALASMTQTGLAAVLQKATQSEGSSGGTPNPSFPAVALTANLILGAVGNVSNPAGMDPPTGTTPTWTEDRDIGINNPNCGIMTISTASGFISQQVTWGNTSATSYADMIIEFDTRSVNPWGWEPESTNQPLIEREGMVPY